VAAVLCPTLWKQGKDNRK